MENDKLGLLNAWTLSMDELGRVTRLARLKKAAIEMMGGDEQAATQWLNTRNAILGGESPINHASTDLGARDVADLIGRIRAGVFS